MARPVFSGSRVHVRAVLCSTCIFRPGNLMRLDPGRVAGMIRECLASESGNIVCHETTHGQAPQRAICRGFWDRYGHRQAFLQMAVRLGIIQEIP